MRNGNGDRGGRWTWTALGMAAVLAAAPGAAAAQDEFDDGPRINYTLYGGVAVDGYDTNIQILGGSVRPAGTGLRPMAGISVYRLGYEDPPNGNTDVYAVNPSIGGGYFTEDGQVSAMVGYSLVNDDNPVPVFGGGGGGSGVTTALQALYWGADPDVEAIAAYSWEPEYLWSNVVVVQPILALGNGTLGVGLDGVYEEQMTPTGRSAYSIGPAVRWTNDLNLGVTLAGGYRKAETRDATWYVRLGGAFYQ
jgi:hypothetical protein